MSQPRRILVYGVTGAGKTTMAERISQRTGIPWYSVDDLTHEPGWVDVPTEIQKERITEICERDEWILDTAYAKWKEIPLARAELLVALDYSRWLTFSRLLRRTLTRVIDKKPVCNGNIESWRLVLSRQSILLWHVTSYHRKRGRIRRWVHESPGPQVIAFRDPREADTWLKTLGPATREVHHV